MRSAALLLLLLATAGCPGPKSPPDPLTRELPASPVAEPTVAEETWPDYRDAGELLIDGGCCTVAFALAAEAGEVAAVLRFHADTYAMSLDGGVWRVDACVTARPSAYWYQTGYVADDDAGTVWLDRINDAVPSTYTSSAAPVVNLFEATEGATCEALDAGVHALVPDAG